MPERKKKSPTKRKPAEFRPVEPRHDTEEEEEGYAGLRRSKRNRIDKNVIPMYKFEEITDFAGKTVRVKMLVGTREKPDLFDFLKKKKSKKTTTIKKQVAPSSSQHRQHQDLMDDFVYDLQMRYDSDNDGQHRAHKVGLFFILLFF